MASSPSRWRRVGVVLGLLVAATPWLPRLAAAETPRLLYPPTKSVLAGPVRLIVATGRDDAAPAATLDDGPLALTRLAFDPSWQLPGKLKATAQKVGDRAAAAVWTAVLDLKPGAHAVVLAGQKIELWRAGEAKAPADYVLLSAHSPVGEAGPKLDCGGCHEQPDGTLGTVPTPKACAGCHSEDDVQLIHRHVSPPLARCAMCHDPHGAARPKMLVDSKEALCSRCHEAGHSKP